MHRVVLVALTSVLLLAVAAGPAAASCLFDERPLEERLAEQPLVFVGTASAVEENGRAARFTVEEVWHGEAGATVTVWGGMPGPGGVATSVDRSFSLGARYLVAARSEGGTWISDSCMPTEEWDEQRHAEARPAAVSQPGSDANDDVTSASDDGSGRTVPLAIAAVLTIGAIGAYGLYRRGAAT